MIEVECETDGRCQGSGSAQPQAVAQARCLRRLVSRFGFTFRKRQREEPDQGGSTDEQQRQPCGFADTVVTETNSDHRDREGHHQLTCPGEPGDTGQQHRTQRQGENHRHRDHRERGHQGTGHHRDTDEKPGDQQDDPSSALRRDSDHRCRQNADTECCGRRDTPEGNNHGGYRCRRADDCVGTTPGEQPCRGHGPQHLSPFDQVRDFRGAARCALPKR